LQQEAASEIVMATACSAIPALRDHKLIEMVPLALAGNENDSPGSFTWSGGSLRVKKSENSSAKITSTLGIRVPGKSC